MCQQWEYYLRCANRHEGYSVYHTTFCPEVVKGVHCLTSCAQDPSQRFRTVEPDSCPGCIYSEAAKTNSIATSLGDQRDTARARTDDLVNRAQRLATWFDDVALRLHFQSSTSNKKKKNTTEKQDITRRTILLDDLRNAVHALEHHNAYIAAIDLALIVARTQLIPRSWNGTDTSHWFEKPDLKRIQAIPHTSCPEWYPRIYRSPKIHPVSHSSHSADDRPENSSRAAEAADSPSELPRPLDIAHDHAERYNIEMRSRTLRRVASREGFSSSSTSCLLGDRRASKSQLSLAESMEEESETAQASRASSRAARLRRQRKISREMALARSRSQSRETMSSDRSVRSEVDPSELVVPMSPDGRI